jgi:hypothetical protein
MKLQSPVPEVVSESAFSDIIDDRDQIDSSSTLQSQLE